MRYRIRKCKVVYGNTTLIDLTTDTVTAGDLAVGVTAHGSDGNVIVGTNDYDSNTSDATATAAEILSGKTAYVNTNKLAGTMPNRGAVTGAISTVSGSYAIPNGYHDGSGSVSIDGTEQAKIIPANIKSGVEILGVEGTYAGEAVSAQSKTATPYITAQTLLPDTGYDYQNASGGITVTIGAVKPE